MRSGSRSPRSSGITFVQIGKIMRQCPGGRACDIRQTPVSTEVENKAACRPRLRRGLDKRTRRHHYPRKHSSSSLLNLWLVRSSPNLAAISPGGQPIPRRPLNKKSEQNQQKVETDEKPGGDRSARGQRDGSHKFFDGELLSHGSTTHRLDARIFSQRAVNWNRADRNYPLNLFAPGFPTAL